MYTHKYIIFERKKIIIVYYIIKKKIGKHTVYLRNRHNIVLL